MEYFLLLMIGNEWRVLRFPLFSSLSLLGLGHLRSLLFLKLSAGAAPRRRSRSALVLAALSVAVAGAQPAGDWIIETVAGVSDSGDGGPATGARLNFPARVALDGAGNLYIADLRNHRIRKVDAAGVITTVAGDGTEGYGGDGGPAVAAQLHWPIGVALDGAGNLYIADEGNNRIRKVDAAGVITTVAGDGTEGYGGDGGPATAAQLRFPTGVAVDGAGNLYIADLRNYRIRKVDAAGVISTVAGDGTEGYGGDGDPATAAQLNRPIGVALDGAGNLYIADYWNHRIRKVDAAGVITTVAGDGTRDRNGDGGAATGARLNHPAGVAVDGAGNLYIADRLNHRIRKVDAAGVISTVAGYGPTGEDEGGFRGDGGPATAARLNIPIGVALDGAGNLYIADTGNDRIRKVDAAGVISTVAGGESLGDGGAATGARLSDPSGVAVDGSGNLYIADTSNGRIRKVDAAGVISTVARLSDPNSVAVDGAGNLYIADTWRQRIRKVDAAGVISTVAGAGTFGYGGDGGPAVEARLIRPTGVAVDGAGNLYIADSWDQRIRKVDAAGVISTVAGDGTDGYGGDGGPATAAQLNYPNSVAVDGAGNLYIADSGNGRIRKVDSAGVISTVAGDGRGGYGGDGGPAVAAELYSPKGVALDGAGNLYIATGNRIRKVDAAGVITTVAGSGMGGFGGDGGPAATAQLNNPAGVALDGDGNLYIADLGNDRIRRLTPPAMPTPSISAGGVVLATATPLVNRISPNALISVYGQGFAPPGTLATSPTLNPAGRVAANLAATCLQIGGKRAPLFVVTPGQINAQVPHDLAPGEAALTVIRGCATANEQRSAAASATVAAVSPAFFNFVSNPDGRNPVVALHGGGPALIGAPGLLPGVEFTPAAPGEVVTLYGTGFGATEPALETGEIPSRAVDLANAVAFTFGGIAVPPADILYKGAAPGLAGVYQFALRLPSNLPAGNATVTATVQGVSTPEGPYLTVRRPQ